MWMLRIASDNDLDDIMVLENGTFTSDAWSGKNMRSELRNPLCHYLVAVRTADPSIVDAYGGLRAAPGAEDADIQTIAVAESARRRGLGRTLMLQLMAEARERGAKRVFLEVRADNPGAQELYRQLGFEPISIRRQYYQPGNVDAVVMRGKLAEPKAALADGSVE